ncbi:MAG: hypothetical protein ACYTGQ_01830, partial [Planctomycetota bacterium]
MRNVYMAACLSCAIFSLTSTAVYAERAGILIGDGRYNGWAEKGVQNIPPHNNRFTHNIITGANGDLLLHHHAPNNTIRGNLLHPQGEATVTHPGVGAITADPFFR